MPLVLIFLGVLLIVAAYRGTQDDLFELLKGDFVGSQNFFYWIVSIFVVGAVGYIPRMKPISDAFLVLILLMLFIRNDSFFSRFNEQVFRR